MLTVFCVRRKGEPPPPERLRGPGGALVRLLEEGRLGVWLSPAAAPADLEAIRLHDAVVRAALRTATPVPARFGTCFEDEHELRSSLREREVELLAALERVEGKVEMGLRVEWEVGEPAAAESAPVRSGRDYLDRRRREIESREELRARAEALLDRLEARVAPEAAPGVRRLLPDAHVAGTLAHLVHRPEVGVYRTRVDDARRAFPEVTLRVTGPWAPYSFV